MDYLITEVTGEFPSNYPDSKKYTFRLKDYPNQVSAFSKFPMKPGDSIHGTIEIKGQYHNFKWVKKTVASPTSNQDLDERFLMVHRKLDAIITELKMARGIRSDNGLTSAGTKVPDFEGTKAEPIPEYQGYENTYEPCVNPPDLLF